jgi:arylsulfatase
VFKALAPVQEDTLVILTADHGEIMDEHDGFFDHHGLYEGNIHVPLIFYWPGKLKGGTRVPGFVQNLDLAPTLLELAGIPDRDGMEGLSLLPPIYGLRDGNYETLYFSEATWQVKRAIRDRRWKLIQALEQDPHGGPMRELYDLQADPAEQRNLVEQHPEIAADLERRLDAWVARRLQETGRAEDPARAQGRCGFRIGKEIPGETIGAGATPLHKRKRSAAAADIPKPEALKAPNELQDNAKGAKLHGYVKDAAASKG